MCRTSSMLRNLSVSIAIAVLLLSATASLAAPVHGRRHVAPHWHGYGFLPGYRFARADRMGGGAQPEAGLLVWRPWLLSGALERRRVRSMLDPDADRQCLELWPIVERDQTGPMRRAGFS